MHGFVISILFCCLISNTFSFFNNVCWKFECKHSYYQHVIISERDSSSNNDDNNLLKKDLVIDNDLKTDRIKIDPLRFISFNLLAVILALGANFLGVTSTLMSNINPSEFENLGFNQIYEINGFRKHVDSEFRYEFKFPSDWIIDQSIVLADIRDKETPKLLLKKRANKFRPEVAYGPKGRNIKENVSVIKSSGMNGLAFTNSLENPTLAAENLLQNYIAPVTTGKTFRLLNAYSDTRVSDVAFCFEYIVQKGEDFNQHCISVIVARNNDLYTLTAVCPESEWEVEKVKLLNIAKSFKLK